MSTRRRNLVRLGARRGGGGILPLDLDFSTFADGALPAPLVGLTWGISGGLAVNTPTLGSELLPDPGLEAGYTAGLCDSLTSGGSPTVAQSADAHGGSKAQEFTATILADYVRFAAVAGTAHVWYQVSAWAKRTAGTSDRATRVRVDQTNGLPAGTFDGFDNAAYKQYKCSILSTDTGNMDVYAAICQQADFDTVIVDDVSLKAITAGDVYAMLPPTQADVIAKIQPPAARTDFAEATFLGVVVRADSTDPTNYIEAIINYHTRFDDRGLVSLFKRVGNTYTGLITASAVTLTADAWLEVRASGPTVSVWYNNIQVGGDQTINDAEIISNKIHGIISTGGNSLNGFFVQAN